MRLCLQSACRFSFLASCLLSQVALSQRASTPGFHFTRDEEQRIVAVEYFGTSGLRSAGLHELTRRESVTISYGTELTRDDIAYLSTLKDIVELEMGFPGASGSAGAAGGAGSGSSLAAIDGPYSI